MSKAKQQKLKKIRRFSGELKLFHPWEGDELRFLCPICLKIFAVPDDLRGIDKAHIFPEAAGGKWSTLLCTKCNNNSGQAQDRWLGDYLKWNNNPESVLVKEKSFTVNGVKFNGSIVDTPGGPVNFIIDPRRNPPDTRSRLNAILRNRPAKIDISIPVPFSKPENEPMFFVGLLTAGYLAWFEVLGYSWALQSHLSVVRRQILQPRDEVIGPRVYCHKVKAPFHPDVVHGVVTIEGMALPAFVFDQCVILYPSFGHSDAYSKLSPKMEGTVHFQQLMFPIQKEPKVVSVSRMSDALVRPDIVSTKLDWDFHRHLTFMEGEIRPYTYKRISDDEYEALRAQNRDVIHVDFKSKKT